MAGNIHLFERRFAYHAATDIIYACFFSYRVASGKPLPHFCCKKREKIKWAPRDLLSTFATSHFIRHNNFDALHHYGQIGLAICFILLN